jgi:hypothetical protein
MSYISFNDLKTSNQLDEQLLYEFFISLLDKLFGQHDQMCINMETETEHNHGIIFLQWKAIKQYFSLPSSVKNTKKLVRQTLLQIVNRLNKKYQFQNPIRMEHKRIDTYEKGIGNITKHWINFSLT